MAQGPALSDGFLSGLGDPAERALAAFGDSTKPGGEEDGWEGRTTLERAGAAARLPS